MKEVERKQEEKAKMRRCLCGREKQESNCVAGGYSVICRETKSAKKAHFIDVFLLVKGDSHRRRRRRPERND